jgi:hypothetical protein
MNDERKSVLLFNGKDWVKEYQKYEWSHFVSAFPKLIFSSVYFKGILIVLVSDH